jgi:hypothetical protein
MRNKQLINSILIEELDSLKVSVINMERMLQTTNRYEYDYLRDLHNDILNNYKSLMEIRLHAEKQLLEK